MLAGLPALSPKHSLSPLKLEENAPAVPTEQAFCAMDEAFFPCLGRTRARACKTPCHKHWARAAQPSQRGVKAGAPGSGSLGMRVFSFSKGKGGNDVCDRSPDSPSFPAMVPAVAGLVAPK